MRECVRVYAHSASVFVSPRRALSDSPLSSRRRRRSRRAAAVSPCTAGAEPQPAIPASRRFLAAAFRTLQRFTPGCQRCTTPPSTPAGPRTSSPCMDTECRRLLSRSTCAFLDGSIWQICPPTLSCIQRACTISVLPHAATLGRDQSAASPSQSHGFQVLAPLCEAYTATPLRPRFAAVAG